MQVADCSERASGTGHRLYSNTVTRGLRTVFPRAELHKVSGATTALLFLALALPWIATLSLASLAA